MRTTAPLDEALLNEAKKNATQSGSTLTTLIEREMLHHRQQADGRRPVNLPTWGHGGLLPGVDLDNSAALLDLVEGLDDPL